MPVTYSLNPKIPEKERIALGKLLEIFYFNFPQYVNHSNTSLNFQPTMRPDLKGTFNSNIGKLTIFQDSTKTQEDLLTTTLHELVHVDQFQEKQKIGEAAQLKKLYPGPAILNLLKKAKTETYLPSMSNESASEFLVSAISDKDIRTVGLKSRYASQIDYLKRATPELESNLVKTK
jgi:hypothetical protein